MEPRPTSRAIRRAQARARVVRVKALLFALGMLAIAPAPAVAPAASSRPDLAALQAREDVEARHALEREAHMERNVDLLMSLMSEDFVLVDGGEVQRPSRAQNEERFRTYFKAVRFRKWDDLAPPSIRVSKDGSLATVLVRKEVVLVSADVPAAEAKEERAVFAWMETWEKRSGRWLLVALCSTRAPQA